MLEAVSDGLLTCCLLAISPRVLRLQRAFVLVWKEEAAVQSGLT